MNRNRILRWQCRDQREGPACKGHPYSKPWSPRAYVWYFQFWWKGERNVETTEWLARRYFQISSFLFSFSFSTRAGGSTTRWNWTLKMATQLTAWVYSFADPLLRDCNRLLPYTSNYHTLSYISFDLVTDELGNRFRHCRLFVAKLGEKELKLGKEKLGKLGCVNVLLIWRVRGVEVG